LAPVYGALKGAKFEVLGRRYIIYSPKGELGELNTHIAPGECRSPPVGGKNRNGISAEGRLRRHIPEVILFHSRFRRQRSGRAGWPDDIGPVFYRGLAVPVPVPSLG